jgi:hypothetical protein
VSVEKYNKIDKEKILKKKRKEPKEKKKDVLSIRERTSDNLYSENKIYILPDIYLIFFYKLSILKRNQKKKIYKRKKVNKKHEKINLLLRLRLEEEG